MKSSVGLLIVHGIGNQRPGSLARTVCRSLEENDEPRQVAALRSGATRDAADRHYSTDVLRLSIAGRAVHVCEADWANLSSPDNTPQLRVAAYLPREYLQTVAQAWQGFVQRTFFPGTEWKALSARGFLAVATVMAFLVLVVNAALSEPGDSEIDTFRAILLGVLVMILLVVSVFNYVRQSVPWVRARLETQTPLVRRVLVAVWLALACIVGYVRFFWLFFLTIFSAEMLLGLLVLVLLTVAVNHVGLMLVLIMEDVSTALSALRLGWLRRWINRISWTLLILPLQSLTQTTKAWARLVSITLARYGAVTRWAAAAAIPGVYLGGLILFGVSAIFFGLAVSVAGALYSDAVYDVTDLIVAAAYLGLVLGIVRILLPVLDLILDISNFHLATPNERRVYFERLYDGLERLKRSGCREIHVLAHSLGTVIAYEWLTSRAVRGHSIKVLHTIGSPLDKFWFTDHSESQRLADEAGAGIPANLRWYNYWAWSDPISGSLDHFGRDAGRVHNVRLKWLGVLLHSHVRYWSCKRVVDDVRAALLAENRLVKRPGRVRGSPPKTVRRRR